MLHGCLQYAISVAMNEQIIAVLRQLEQAFLELRRRSRTTEYRALEAPYNLGQADAYVGASAVIREVIDTYTKGGK